MQVNVLYLQLEFVNCCATNTTTVCFHEFQVQFILIKMQRYPNISNNFIILNIVSLKQINSIKILSSETSLLYSCVKNIT